MLSQIQYAKGCIYKNGKEYEPINFFLEALPQSKTFDLLLGYFSSSAINVLALGFAHFIAKGGKMRVVINDVLSARDKEIILKAQEKDIKPSLFSPNDFLSIKEGLDDYGRHFFNCLAWLISTKRIDIVAIRPKDKNGISHYKSGVFSDGDNQVHFTGSCNFTANALLENLEEITLRRSWVSTSESEFISESIKDFEKMFSGQEEYVDYINIEEIEGIIFNQFGDKDLDALLIQESQLLAKKKKSISKNNALKQKLEELEVSLQQLQQEPKFPFPQGPRPYQLQAYQNWVNNGYQGLFAMATGTGKTITSLNCILEEYKRSREYKFIVLVPTIALANQWQQEAYEKFNFQTVTLCSSKHAGWESALKQYGNNMTYGTDCNFCIIATYASFRGKKFQTLFNQYFGKHLPKITLIADEAHTFGSSQLLAILPHEINKRIGLSATPERVYDQEGQNQLCEFFNSHPPEYTYVYNMQKAIEDEILCRYNYYPKFIELTSEELATYREITKKLTKYIDPATGKYRDNPIVNNLLIQRKNVVHKAAKKENCLTEIIDEIGVDKFKYAFIYVPEGNEPQYAKIDTVEFNEEDNRIIDNYTEILHKDYNLRLRKFLGETTDRDEILGQFSRGELDAILAMKCLDEGVDVPRTQYAIFCSSTGNPRQYIQRRGRVLRTHKDKKMAYIYDMVVKPPIDITQGESKEYKLEKNLLKSELNRLINFAALAENKMYILREIEDLAQSYDIDIYEMMNNELEKY
ncbi:DEAD/DEAH box helicase family protein [Rufibacter sp. XAAS-G3-1]|uniref:DEAD/DEAH box helicase family protein n=1 Tax=Rufibacter sp. XAAS-G3-1 TaxID=2729134 RepID=UPI0015E667D9|nr:DEAD/DEAH box helicase family protein [Rufibacter sp. XAAS-G3-1]